MLLKKRIDLHFSLKLGAIIILCGALIAGIGGHSAVNYPTYTTNEQNVVGVESITTGHYSVASNGSELYSAGEKRANESTYFNSTHKKLYVNFYGDEPQYNTTVNISAVASRSSNVIWQRPAPNDIYTRTVSGTTIINIKEFKNASSRFKSELPLNSRIKLTVSARDTSGSTDLNPATTTVYFDTQRTYQVTTNQSSNTITETTETIHPSPSRTITMSGVTVEIFGFVVSLLGAGLIGIGGYLMYGAKYDDRGYETRLFKYHLEKYESWITLGRPFNDPEMEKQGTSKVTVDSLEGLVHIAVDSDTRVIYAEEMERFYVYNDTTVYFYAPPVESENPYQKQFGQLMNQAPMPKN